MRSVFKSLVAALGLAALLSFTPAEAQFNGCSYGFCAAGVDSAPDLPPVSNACSTSSGTTITFTAQGIGNASPTRTTVVSINWSDSTSAGTAELTGVSVGGIAMVRAVRASGDNQNSNSEIWYVANPTGTTANIVLTAGSTIDGVTIEVYSLVGWTSAPIVTATGTSSVSATYGNKQGAIAAGSRTTNVSTSMSNMTNDFSSACGASLWGVHASQRLNGNGTLTSALSPSTSNPKSVMAIWSTQTSDPSWASVVLLAPFDGTNGSTAAPGFKDFSSAAHGTATVTSGSPSISTSQFKFGPSSLFLNGGFISWPNSADWLLSTANSSQFTIELWANFTGIAANNCLVCVYEIANKSWAIFTNNTEFYFQWNISSCGTLVSLGSTGAGFVTGQWYAITVDKNSGGVLRAYVNGVMVGKSTPADSTMCNTGNGLNVGNFGGGGVVQGYVDEIRITKGVARYQSDSGYTVSTVPFPIN